MNDDDCPFCWGTGVITVMEPVPPSLRNAPEPQMVAVTRPCPEGCLAPEEVP